MQDAVMFSSARNATHSTTAYSWSSIQTVYTVHTVLHTTDSLHLFYSGGLQQLAIIFFMIIVVFVIAVVILRAHICTEYINHIYKSGGSCQIYTSPYLVCNYFALALDPQEEICTLNCISSSQ